MHLPLLSSGTFFPQSSTGSPFLLIQVQAGLDHSANLSLCSPTMHHLLSNMLAYFTFFINLLQNTKI